VSEGRLSRRALLRIGSSLAALIAVPRGLRAQALDQGIGGTGVAPGSGEPDQGIGGTGVIGTIRRFGSIVVNDMRIAYPSDAEVRLDGRPARIEDLRIGQVVQVVAVPRDGGLATRRIDVTSEVVGPVERKGTGTITVLGQTVTTGDLAQPFAGRVGDMVAVSGLRRPDGAIVASLVEGRPGATPLVAGPVTRAKDGSLRIGALRLAGLDPTLVGQRVVTTVGGRRGAYVATRPFAAQNPFGSQVTRLSVEAYVDRDRGALRLGSGFAVGGGRDLDLPAHGSIRAVLSTSIAADGRPVVTSARFDAQGRGPGGAGAPRGGSRGDARPAGGAAPAGRGGPGRDQPGGFGGGGGGSDGGGFGPGPGGGPPGGFGNGPPGGGFGGGRRR
jgi:hypothetical protein